MNLIDILVRIIDHPMQNHGNSASAFCAPRLADEILMKILKHPASTFCVLHLTNENLVKIVEKVMKIKENQTFAFRVPHLADEKLMKVKDNLASAHICCHSLTLPVHLSDQDQGLKQFEYCNEYQRGHELRRLGVPKVSKKIDLSPDP